MEKNYPEPENAKPAVKRAQGRSGTSRDQKNYANLLSELEPGGSAEAVRKFAFRIREILRGSRRETVIEVVSIKRMLRGVDRMSPAVFLALHQAAGFEQRGLPEAIWESQTVTEFNRIRDAPAKDLLGEIRRLPRGPDSGPIKLIRIGPSLSRVAKDGGPPRLSPGAHRFQLIISGMLSAWVVFIEYGHNEAQWWSLIGTEALTRNREPLGPETEVGHRIPMELVINIGEYSGSYEIFALVSKEQFDVRLFDIIKQNDQRGPSKEISDTALAKFLEESRNKKRNEIYAASFSYRV